MAKISGHRFYVFIVNFEHVHLFNLISVNLMFLMPMFNMF